MFRYYSPNYYYNRVTIVGEHKDGKLKLAASRCSNKDNFSRKVGRELAEKRLQEGKIIAEIPMLACNSKLFVQFAISMADVVRDNKVVCYNC
jgi:hypothetical protein